MGSLESVGAILENGSLTVTVAILTDGSLLIIYISRRMVHSFNVVRSKHRGWCIPVGYTYMVLFSC